MKLIRNSITDDLYQKCIGEFKEKTSENCWKSSTVDWIPEIKKGILGSCIQTFVSNTISNLLKEELKSFLPEYKELVCQYYIWQPQSGISWHSDGHSRFGATLYLNDVWHPDGGGWFIWQDGDGYHTILPERKLLVLNNNNNYHCVTPVSPDSPIFRYTIQLWGNY